MARARTRSSARLQAFLESRRQVVDVQVRNRQPWPMEPVGADEIVVRIDTDRLLPETDPFGRRILTGTGAMLGLLDIAAAEAATKRGLVMHPLSRALQEYAAMGAAHADAQALLGGPRETVQMLCRVGHLPPGESSPAAAPRRGLGARLVA